mmetsp:Transcript_9322/g.18791  ORF Transcript_9322/g.18791 Transcript_9322/m.18791 type:complete len:591 (+) Transcript_9322:104-1876(+)
MIKRCLFLLSLPRALTLAFLPQLPILHAPATHDRRDRAVGFGLAVEGGCNDPVGRQGASTELQRDKLSDVIVYCRDFREWVPKSKRSQESNIPKKTKMSVVMKFGGSSLANEERIDNVAKLIKDQRTLGTIPRAVVCSAMGQTTDWLLRAGESALLKGRANLDAFSNLHRNAMTRLDLPQNTIKEVNALLEECEDLLRGVSLLEELSPKTLDQLASYGERCTVRIVAARLNQIGVPAQAFDSWDVGIVTDSSFGNAKILSHSDEAIPSAFRKIDPSIVAVVTGFIGRDVEGSITTLGRGGDLTATQLGGALKSDEIQIWKDVDGILTSDPRVVPHAIPVDELSYHEASELAHFGAKVLHPAAISPAMRHNVPVRVKNSYNPAAVGTIIRNEKSESSNSLVTTITYKRDVKLLDIRSTQALGAYGFLSSVFGKFEKHKLSVDVLASSEVSISLTLDKKQTESKVQDLIRDLSIFSDVTVKTNMSILTLIADVDRSSEVLATVFRVFSNSDIKVKMMSQGASKVNISFIVESDCLDKAILELHKCFFEGKCSIPITAGRENCEAELLTEIASFPSKNMPHGSRSDATLSISA